MTPVARHFVLIVAVGAVVLLSNLGGPRLWDRDEPRNAGCTREMLARSDWVTPVFDGELRTHKPILLYWFMMTAYGLFGETEFAARFWSAVAAVGTALVTYGMGRRLCSPAVGLWAAVILLTTLMFGVAGRAATPDALLIFWSTAAVGVYVAGTFPAHEPNAATWVPQPARFFPSRPVAVGLYACMGLAALAKGPVGVLLPTAVIGLYLLIEQLPAVPRVTSGGKARRWLARVRAALRPFAPRHFLQTCWRMRPLTAIAVIVLVALPWYGAVAYRTDGAWLRGFLLDHNLGRAARSLEGHGGTFLYYPVALLVGFFPWSVFAAPVVLEILRRLRQTGRHHPGIVLALCWIGVYVALFSLARTKLPSYITPCYPAVAILVACFVTAWWEGTHLVGRGWITAAFVCLGAIAIAMLVVLPWAVTRYLPGELWLTALAVPPLVTSVAGLALIHRAKPARAAVLFAAGALVLNTGLFAVATVRVDRHQTFHTFVDIVHDLSPQAEVGTLGVTEPSWVFYLRRPLDRLVLPELASGNPTHVSARSPEQAAIPVTKPARNVWEYLRQRPHRYVITSERFLRSIGGTPPGIDVIAQTPYFLRDDTLLLLAAP